MTETANWNPTWVVSPGEVLTEALEERGMTQAELGRRMARPLKTISEIATGKAAITPETAIQLERALGISVATWLALESRYREARARERDSEELKSHVEWLRMFPIKELIERGIIRRKGSEPQRAADLLSYLGVSSPAGWEQYWGQVAASYRMSEKLSASPHAVTVWIREAEREAADLELPSYSMDGLEAQVPALRSLTTANVTAAAIAQARDLLMSVGVGLLLMKGIRGAPASGAVRWVRGNPWIVLTLRHRTDDQLWFSLFHEVGHLLEGGRRRDVIEAIPGEQDSESEDEHAADTFARDVLLPEFAWNERAHPGSPNRATIKEVASEYGVAPGIVVGRLERDGLIPPGRFRDLKRRVGSSS